MKCIILAAGYATRLYPLTKNYPKPLLDVGGKPIIDWLIDDLSENTNIKEFVVISNHKFAHFFDDWAVMKSEKMKKQYEDFNIAIVDDGTETNENRLGAVKDIKYAIDKLNITDDVFVMAGDNLLDFSLAGFVRYVEEKATSCVMCHKEHELKKQQKTAIITFDENGCITSYEEKPIEPKGHYAVPPFYIYSNKDIKRIGEALADGCGADAPGSYAAWLSHKTPMHAYIMPGKRYDIGDVESYEGVKRIFEKGWIS